METAYKMIAAEGFRIFITVYFLFELERLSALMIRTLYKVLIGLLILYAYPSWEFAADTYLLKLQRLENAFVRTVRKFPGCTRPLSTA
jgi:hypothetical protein